MKNIMHKSGIGYFIAFFIAVAIIVSCQESEVQINKKNNLPTLLDYYDLLTKPTDGIINIQSSTGLLSQSGVRNNSIDASFGIDALNENARKFFSVSVNSIQLESLENGRVSTSLNSQEIGELYGKKVSFQISGSNEAGRTTATISGEIYVPELISIEGNLETIAVGNEIRWNSDPLNYNGVIIMVEYTALTQSLPEIINLYPEDIFDGFVVPDTGSVTITQEMLEYLPIGADVKITIARANIDYIVTEDQTYTVGGITSVTTKTTFIEAIE